MPDLEDGLDTGALARLRNAGRPLPSARPGPGPAGDRLVVRGFRDATIVYVDVPNLAGVAASTSTALVIRMLDALYQGADRAAARHGLSGVVVAGAAYAAVSGVPAVRADHACAAAEMALDTLEAARQFAGGDGELALRIGVHSGPVVAAMGEEDGRVHELWGESARVARRLESTGVAGLVHLSGATAALLAGRYRLEPRLRVEAGARSLGTFFLGGRRA